MCVDRDADTGIGFDATYKKARVQGLKTGTLNCLVLAEDHPELLDGTQIQRCVLLDADEFPARFSCTRLNEFHRSEIPDQLKEMVATGEFHLWREDKPSGDSHDISESPSGTSQLDAGGQSSAAVAEMLEPLLGIPNRLHAERIAADFPSDLHEAQGAVNDGPPDSGAASVSVPVPQLGSQIADAEIPLDGHDIERHSQETVAPTAEGQHHELASADRGSWLSGCGSDCGNSTTWR